jgi:histidinol-phosphate aminotransferase
MEIDFRSLANSYISNLVPYQPGKPIEEVERELGITSAIKLASNENPLGASPLAMIAAQHALLKSHFYPDGGSYNLKQALSTFLQVNPTQLTIGNGSENVLEIIIKSYLNKDNAAVISQYAFLTIPLLIKSYGAEIICVPADNFRHDINKMIAAVTENTSLLFIVNPNNPTGTYTSNDELIHLLESIPSRVLVIIDEAYNEYINQDDYPDTLQLLKKYPNLIITRTFSKAYGLAALRLGYAASSPEIAYVLNCARLPFNVNSIAAAAAEAALNDHEHIQKSIALNNEGMQQLEEGLKKLNIDYIPSLGNFITMNVKTSAMDVYQKLLYEGVIVRPLVAYDMPTYIRVTVGTAEQNERFLKEINYVIVS